MPDVEKQRSPDVAVGYLPADVDAKDGSDPPSHTELKRQLKNRHVTMISIGGVIGTGLFVGTASSLASGGPVGLLLGYSVMGSICYAVMISVGEMISFLPVPGGHIKLAERFIDPAFSFTMGWMYWYSWVITLPAELSAAAVLINYWTTAVNNAVWITICLVVVFVINMFGAGVYGECEFWFASIKVITITGLIILGIVLDLGGGPHHDRIGFRYWKNPGPFNQYAGLPDARGQFLAWWSVMSQAAFSFVGTEMVALAAGETKDPRRSLPKAIKSVYIRIILFYVLGTFVIGLLVPYTYPGLSLNSSNAAGSPFVIAIVTSGIQGLPSVINAALLTSAWSAASSDTYASSRALYGLAIAGNAPRIFARTTRNGLPYVSVIFSSLFSLLAFMVIQTEAGTVFGYLSNMTAMSGLMAWFGIGVIYLRFHAGLKAQGIERKTLPYVGMGQPFVAWYVILATLIICFFSGWSVFLEGNWSPGTFITNYIPLALFPVLYFGYKFITGCQTQRAKNIDLTSGVDEFEDLTDDDGQLGNRIDRLWGWLL